MYFLLPAVLFALQCTAQQPAKVLNLDAGHVVIVADSALAARYIVTDTMDYFFKRVSATEMSIQMKNPLENLPPAADLVKSYREFLQSDVEGFSQTELETVEKTMRQMFSTCMQVNSDLFPDTLVVIKTKAKHYGEGVYYTRANTIIIPQDALAPGNQDAFHRTMYHELFHVFSRLNPKKREDLYQLIGFSSLGYERLQVPKALADRLLHNPDGVDFAQKIDLKQPDGAVIHAIPVIYANETGFTKGKPLFFGYLEFELFQIEQTGDGRWKVLTKPDGYRSTLDLRKQPDFFRQIRDNTGYIIHPDEVLADNFAYILEGLERGAPVKKFSDSGSQLLRDIEAVLRRP
jgi:hypothetical protein